MEQYITIKEYAEKEGVSTTAVYKKEKRGTIKTIEKDGIKYVEVGSEATTKKPSSNQHSNQPSNQDLVAYLEKENERLNQKLEEKDKEIADLNKEIQQYQQESKEELKELQREKDLQIKNYFEFLANENNKLLAHAVHKPEPETEIIEEPEPDHHEAEIIEDDPKEQDLEKTHWISLNKHLKDKKFKKEYRIKVMKNAQKLLLEDSKRFMIKDRKVYIDPLSFEYRDLF